MLVHARGKVSACFANVTSVTGKSSNYPNPLFFNCFCLFVCLFHKNDNDNNMSFFSGYKINFSGSFALVSRLPPFSINIAEFQLQLLHIIVLTMKPVSESLGVR